MRRLTLASLVPPCLVFAGLVQPLAAEPLNRRDRDYAMSVLHATRKQFVDAVAALPEAQWRFQPAPDRWSIAQVAEHLVATEEFFGTLVRDKLVKAPAQPDQKSAYAGKDVEFVAMIADRSEKAKAPEMLKPTDKSPNRDALLARFRELRDANIRYVETTQDELRTRFMPFGEGQLIDAYQALLLMGAHTERHVKQMREVQADAKYPK